MSASKSQIPVVTSHSLIGGSILAMRLLGTRTGSPPSPFQFHRCIRAISSQTKQVVFRMGQAACFIIIPVPIT